MTTPYDCIIVANGLFPSTALPLEFLHNAPAIIACDGAAQAVHDRGLEPTAIIGDMDSIPLPLREQYAERIYIVEDQEINDLTKSVLYAHENGYRNILILGATGLREDHALGNIALLSGHAPLFNRIEMLSDYGWFIPLQTTTTLPCQPGQQISIFSMDVCGKISTEGLRWPLRKRKLSYWWEGTLNEALGDSFTITLFNNAKVIVYCAL